MSLTRKGATRRLTTPTRTKTTSGTTISRTTMKAMKNGLKKTESKKKGAMKMRTATTRRKRTTTTRKTRRAIPMKTCTTRTRRKSSRWLSWVTWRRLGSSFWPRKEGGKGWATRCWPTARTDPPPCTTAARGTRERKCSWNSNSKPSQRSVSSATRTLASRVSSPRPQTRNHTWRLTLSPRCVPTWAPSNTRTLKRLWWRTYLDSSPARTRIEASGTLFSGT
mmetsp:Transcript_54376/g.107925  ORF Transcript_54376/g.107925 Transcript_54376/m.107925 type:complete len:222 (+) Transcript_54376:291-956(+)